MEKKIAEWLKNKKALLITNNNTDRSGYRRAIKDAGVDQNNVFSADSFNTAKEIIETNGIDIVFCQYQLEETRGIELFKLYESKMPLSSERIFVFVSEINSPFIAAICGDLSIDGLIVKPFNFKDLEKAFKGLVVSKLSLSITERKISLLEASNSSEEFEKTMLLAKSIEIEKDQDRVLYNSALAFALEKNNKKEEAKNLFEEALKISPLHHKTLVRYFHFLNNEKFYGEAYEVARTLTSNFPVNPFRISDYIKISIATKNYQTVINFCDSLSEINELEEEIKKHVGAGLSLASKYLLMDGERKFAYKAAKKVIDLGIKQTSILATAMNTLIDLDQVDSVEKIIDSIPSDEMDEELLIIDLKYTDKKQNAGVVFQKGIELTTKNIHSIEIYEILIRRAKELNRSYEQIDDLIFNAAKFNPASKKRFELMR